MQDTSTKLGRVKRVLLFIGWGIVLCTWIVPAIIYVVWDIDWFEVIHQI